MKPFYAARVEDLGPGDHVLIECQCGHSERVTGSMFLTAGVKPFALIKDLDRRLRCRECDKKGKVVISIKWAD